MRFPLSLTTSMSRYLMSRQRQGVKRFPLVLMLEPLFACNLHCAGCGRVREFKDCMSKTLSVDECLNSIDECGAPVISICGGEPLIYPDIVELIEKTLEKGKHIYLCTNAQILEKKLPEFKPHPRFFINVHLDGLEKDHDAGCCKPGAFQTAIDGIKAAKKAGFFVCTNTTLYKETPNEDVVELFKLLKTLNVNAALLSPAFSYDAFSEEQKEELFLTRAMIEQRFRELEKQLKGTPLFASPIFMDFLTGRRDMNCAAWANPTRNPIGWKGPCYLLTDKHYETYQEMLDQTDWDALGPGKDARCEHCKTHCGFEPASVFESMKSVRDMIRILIWNIVS